MSPQNGAPRPGKITAPPPQESPGDNELQKARTEINQNLINPLAECQNLLQGLRFDELDALLLEESSLTESLALVVGAKEAARITKRITTELLPQLQRAVTQLTNDPAFGAQVSLSSLLEAVRRVHTKEKARRDFSYELMDAIRSTSHTVFNENNSDPKKKIRPKELKRDSDIAALTQHLEAYSSTDPHDIAEARAAAETALRSLLTKRGWQLAPDALLGPHVNVKELWNKASGQGSGVRALSDVFLRELEVNKKTAFDTIESRLGKKLLLPKDSVATRSETFLNYYQRLEQSQPDTFIADRLVPHMEPRADGSLARTKEVVSLSTPVSKMLLALQTKEEADAMVEEGISAELPASFSFETTHKEFETFLADTLLNAAKVAEGKNRDGSKKIASNKDIVARAHTLASTLSPELLQTVYKEARDITKEEWAKEQKTIEALTGTGTYATIEAPPHPDNFTMLQAAFTYILLDKVGFPEALTDVTGGIFTKPLTMGVRHADEVTARLQSLELNESIGQKRLIIETFINTLPDAVEDILKDPAAHHLPSDENTLQRIRHATQALWLLATELREGRLNVDDVRKKETARLLENFALAYGTLVRRGIVRPVSMTLPEVERLEGESDTEYAERAERVHQERKTRLAEERAAFRTAQAQHIAQDLLGFLQKLDSGEDLRQNFIGTLGQILGKRGKELKTALTQKMNEVATNPELFERAHAPQTFELRRGRNASAASLIPSGVAEGGFRDMLRDFERQVSDVRRRFNSLHNKLNALRQSILASQSGEALVLAIQKLNVEEDEAYKNAKRLDDFVSRQPDFIQVLLTTKSEFASKLQSGSERVREYMLAATDVRIILFAQLLQATIEQSKAEGAEDEMKETIEELSARLIDLKKSRDADAAREALQLFL
jgi:hypothetical protein